MGLKRWLNRNKQGKAFSKNYSKLQSDDERVDALLEAQMIAEQDGNSSNAYGKNGAYDGTFQGLTTAQTKVYENMSPEMIQRFMERKDENEAAMMAQFEELYASYRSSGMDDEKAKALAGANVQFGELGHKQLLFGNIMRHAGMGDDIDTTTQVTRGLGGAVNEAVEERSRVSKAVAGYGDADRSTWGENIRKKYEQYERSTNIQNTLADASGGLTKQLGAGGAREMIDGLQEQNHRRGEATRFGDARKKSRSRIGSTPDKKRMEEIRFNDFSSEKDLPTAFRDASTSDIAAFKMLQNVKPEDLDDPVFVAQLNRFIGGNFASAIQKKIGGLEAAGRDALGVRSDTFRDNPGFSKNLSTAIQMQLDHAKFGNHSVTEQIEQDFGSGEEDNYVAMLENLSLALGPEGSASSVSDLLGIAAQGMNGSRSFSDMDRSTQMMNQLMLRGVMPRITVNAHERQFKGADEETRALGTKQKKNAQRLMSSINRPDNLENGIGQDTVQAIKQFSSQLSWEGGSGATTANPEVFIPKNEMTGQSYDAPAPASEKKKHWWDRFKKKSA